MNWNDPREIIERFIYDRLTISELSQIFEISENKIKRRIRKFKDIILDVTGKDISKITKENEEIKKEKKELFVLIGKINEKITKMSYKKRLKSKVYNKLVNEADSLAFKIYDNLQHETL